MRLWRAQTLLISLDASAVFDRSRARLAFEEPDLRDPPLPRVQRSQSALNEANCLGTSRRITGASSGNSSLRAPRGRKSNSLSSFVPSPVGVNVQAIVRSGFPLASYTSLDGRS